jgi:hypothetical protein
MDENYKQSLKLFSNRNNFLWWETQYDKKRLDLHGELLTLNHFKSPLFKWFYL